MLSNGMAPSRSVLKKRKHPSEVRLFAPEAPSSSTLPPDDDEADGETKGPSIFDVVDFIDDEDDEAGTPGPLSEATSISEKDQKETLEKELKNLDLDVDPDSASLEGTERELLAADLPTAEAEDLTTDDDDDNDDFSESAAKDKEDSSDSVENAKEQTFEHADKDSGSDKSDEMPKTECHTAVEQTHSESYQNEK